MLEWSYPLTVLSMKDVISFVCTEIPFLEDAQICLRSLETVIFSLEIPVMFSSGAGPEINNQNSRDGKLPVRNSEHTSIYYKLWRLTWILCWWTYKMIRRLRTGCNMELVVMVSRQPGSSTDWLTECGGGGGGWPRRISTRVRVRDLTVISLILQHNSNTILR